ncbi:LptA/OstA family protein [Puniceicoccus vermicola]|uniref:LPS export ABC transporter periplasmic protein LptC n=1 Tax=Puniceicoccus vermicola TaxID=388746 RepID=A0A7X1AXW8_9BACT|nr:LPS export ABC transporter periplasmic protein LptC [Puniceicoccus vermicola]MBC2600840.1 LPS export ABC transporter periplasmic protein LptC [Puniceicoccus vermicola]
MRFHSRFLAASILTAITILSCGSLQAEVKPDAEVKSFTFRKFNDQGLRIWDLSGQEAVFVNDNVLRIIEMQLDITSTKDQEETRLRSPNAQIYVEDNMATGDGFLYVQGNGFNAEGKDWEWRGRERRIEINDGAKVTFDDAIRRILK